ncbi:hypothetical protein JX266_012631 [Neoarthrinium moseri]|nr:uncharacterized protein JN550_001746 [Neoarthrinium moseri]KAI1841164.1 hypothetical protein JX266_012631 [Neoarthrinium moseri]KAI1876250.1 hypothetical protein JN550_001746 [Neoarthrinium moseri]
MSTSSLPYYQRVFYKNAEDLKAKEPSCDFDKCCFYMLNVCEVCGHSLDGQPLPAKSGKAKFSIATATTEYTRHDARNCDKRFCKKYIVGAYAHYGMRCCYCGV